MADTSAFALWKQRQDQAVAAMQAWGSKPISTVGQTEWTPEGAAKAQLVLETLGSFAPIAGQVIASKDYNNAMENNDSAGGVLAATQFMPMIGGVSKLGSSFFKPSAYALKMMRRGNVAEQGMEKAIKHGGQTSVMANTAQAIRDWF